MRIAIDISGGDFAPSANVLGAILAQKELPSEVRLVLIGREEEILETLAQEDVDPELFDIVHAPDIITMHDHPTRAIPQKPQSSISLGFQLLANISSKYS